MSFLMFFAVFATAAAAQAELNATTTTAVEVDTTTPYTYKKPTWGGCRPRNLTIPHGQYRYIKTPGRQEFVSIAMEIVCDPGYGIKKGSGSKRLYCDIGLWSDNLIPMAECELYCKIPELESVEFRCPVGKHYKVCHRFYENGTIVRTPCPIPEGADQGYRNCKEYEPKGTEVQPVCKNGYHGHSFVNVTCSDGKWYGPPSVADILKQTAKQLFRDDDENKVEKELILGAEVTSWECSRGDAKINE